MEYFALFRCGTIYAFYVNEFTLFMCEQILHNLYAAQYTLFIFGPVYTA